MWICSSKDSLGFRPPVTLLGDTKRRPTLLGKTKTEAKSLPVTCRGKKKSPGTFASHLIVTLTTFLNCSAERQVTLKLSNFPHFPISLKDTRTSTKLPNSVPSHQVTLTLTTLTSKEPGNIYLQSTR